MTFLVNDKIFIRLFGLAKHDAGNWHNGRKLTNNLIVYMNSGSLQMEIDGNVYEAKKGDALFVGKGTFYRPLESQGCSYYFFHFDAEERDAEQEGDVAVAVTNGKNTLFSYYFDSQACYTVTIIPFITSLNQTVMGELFDRASKLDFMNNRKAKMVLEMCFKEFLAEIEYSKDIRMYTNNTVNRLTDYIAENITQPISLQNLSETFHLSKSYIARLFKKELKESAGSYILKQKIQKASSLLISTGMSIQSISEYLGFSSQYYFSKVFSDNMGMPPTVFRKLQGEIKPIFS